MYVAQVYLDIAITETEQLQQYFCIIIQGRRKRAVQLHLLVSTVIENREKLVSR